MPSFRRIFRAGWRLSRAGSAMVFLYAQSVFYRIYSLIDEDKNRFSLHLCGRSALVPPLHFAKIPPPQFEIPTRGDGEYLLVVPAYAAYSHSTSEGSLYLFPPSFETYDVIKWLDYLSMLNQFFESIFISAP